MRDSVKLLNLRAGFGTETWTVTAWSRNLTDEEYNAEWSPGPQFFPNPGYTNNFVFKAQPSCGASTLPIAFKGVQAMSAQASLPTRLHHTAYVSRDLEATRQFYEDVIGLPLVATWCESDILFGSERTYCHLFFALADGSALAFFQFARSEDAELFGPKMPPSPFHHIALHVDQATQSAIEGRIKQAGIQEPRTYVLDHGYCRSLYVEDPNGMILEFTCDHPAAGNINAKRKADAHSELKRWLGGDHTSNNMFR